MDPHEPYWRTNTSFSPPPSRWDFHFQPDALSYGSNDGSQLYESSTSPNSKGSRGWVRRNLLYNHQYSTSDGTGPFLSSPSDLSQGPQWTPPVIQEITLDDYGTATSRDNVGGQLPFASAVEGTSTNADSGVSTSSYSDSSESEPMVKQSLSSHRNISSRYCFMSKPIHPLSIPMETPTTEASDSAVAGLSDDATPQRDAHRWSSASSSNDFADISEPFESVNFGRSCIPSSGFKCSLCERFLSQRSPWSARRIVRSSDMPVAGVLSCGHTFHAECLEHTTQKTRISDPPCPLCAKIEEQNSPENRVFSKFRNSISRLRPFAEDGPSRTWSCAQVGDCVQGALHTPPQNTMLLLNQSRMKKNLFVKVNSSKEFPGKLRKSGSSPLQLFSGKSIDQGAVGCSKTIAGPSMKRKWKLGYVCIDMILWKQRLKFDDFVCMIQSIYDDGSPKCGKPNIQIISHVVDQIEHPMNMNRHAVVPNIPEKPKFWVSKACLVGLENVRAFIGFEAPPDTVGRV